MDVYIDKHISIFDFIIAGIMLWSFYKGYMQGFIVQTIALFVLLAGVFVGSKVSMSIYYMVMDKSVVALPNFPVVVFALMFGFIIFGADWTARIVQKQVESVPKPISTRVLGAFFGGVKYAFIISVFLLFVDRIDQNVHIIPDNEKSITLFYEPFKEFAPTILPRLKFEARTPKQADFPDDAQDMEIEELPDYNDIGR